MDRWATRSTAALQLSHHLEQAAKDYATSVKYPASPLAGKLKQVAQLIDAGLGNRVYYVTLDGFDTHSDQAAAHSGLLQQLGDALAAFAEDLQVHGHLDRVASLVFSEFGRRVQENSSRGTDHGAAAPLFVIGSKVKAGIVGPDGVVERHRADGRDPLSKAGDQAESGVDVCDQLVEAGRATLDDDHGANVDVDRPSLGQQRGHVGGRDPLVHPLAAGASPAMNSSSPALA